MFPIERYFFNLPFILERLISVGQATRYKRQERTTAGNHHGIFSATHVHSSLAAMCVAKYATDYSLRGILNKLTES